MIVPCTSARAANGGRAGQSNLLNLESMAAFAAALVAALTLFRSSSSPASSRSWSRATSSGSTCTQNGSANVRRLTSEPQHKAARTEQRCQAVKFAQRVLSVALLPGLPRCPHHRAAVTVILKLRVSHLHRL